MAIPIRQATDYNQNEIRNVILQNLGGAPSNPKVGQVYFNTATPPMGFIWNGLVWRPMDAAGLTDGSVPIAALATNPLARANQTGTQASSTISDLAVTVQSYTLDKFGAPVAPISWNGQTLTGLANAVAATGAVPLSQVQSLIAAAVAGQTAIKNPVRALASANVTASATQTIDGVALNVGDRVALQSQSTGSQNGIYIVASGAWSLATDSNTNTSFQEGSEFLVSEGTVYGGTIWRCTNTGAITIGTTTLTFVQTAKINTYTADELTLHVTGTQFSAKLAAGLTTAAGGITIDTTVVNRKFSANITGDGTTTSFVVTHNLGTVDVIAQLRDSTNLVDYADITNSGVNTTTVTFGTAPPNGTAYRLTCTG